MKASSLPTVLRSLGRADSSAESDAALLGRFVAGGDQPAFAELVRRYARLVWWVARTRCRTDATAEDVFQAAFVVLARKAKSLRPPVALAGWLHLTAHRLAVKAARKDRPTAPLPADAPASADPLDALSTREMLTAVDDEMAKLSDAERAVLVLCGVENCTLDEAAGLLGWTVGSAKGRLERARAKLRTRLDARGLTVPTVLVGLIGWPPAATVQAATIAATGGVTRPAVAPLIVGGTTVKGTIAKATLALVLVGALVAVGGWDGDTTPGPRVSAAPIPKATKDEGLIWLHNERTHTLTAWTPDGKKAQELSLKDGSHFLGLTPDGTQIQFAGRNGRLADDKDTDGLTLHLRGISDETEGTDTGVGFQRNDQFVLSPDRTRVVRVRYVPVGRGGYEHALVDLATKKETPVDLPAGHRVRQWAADGKTWRVFHDNRDTDPKLPNYRWLTATVEGKPKLTPVCDTASADWLDPSPDGKTFLSRGHLHADESPWFKAVLRIDRATGQAHEVKRADPSCVLGAMWSLDGTRIACLTSVPDRTDKQHRDTRLLLLDADGTNEKELVLLPDDDQKSHLFGWFPSPTGTGADSKAKPPAREPIKAPVPKEQPRETRLLVWVGDKPVVLRPDGTVLDGPAAIAKATILVKTGNAVSSPDGRRVVFAGETDPPESTDEKKGAVLRRGVRLLTLQPGETPQVVKHLGAFDPVWLGSDRLVLSGRELADDGTTTGSLKTWVYDTTTGQRAVLKVPEKFVVQAVSPDGQSAVAVDVSNPDDPFTRPCHLVPLDGGKPIPLLGADHVVRSPSPPQFSPDGGRVLLQAERMKIDPNKKVGDEGRVKVLAEQLLAVDVKTRKAVTIADAKDGVTASGWQWSPDGKRIAFVRQKWDAVRGGSLKGKSQLLVTVTDVDGNNPQDVFETRGSFEHVGRTGVTVAWSPDGKRLAVLHQEADSPAPGVNEKYSARVVVMDADGSHPSEVYKAGDTSWMLMGFDWR